MRRHHWVNKYLFVVAVYVAGINTCAAITIAGGSIDTSAAWEVAGSPYVIEADANVAAGETLVINPGVTVLFNPGVSLTVNGALVARGGVPDQLITFSANNDAISWAGIVFEDTAEDARYDNAKNYESGSILEHVIIEKVGAIPANSRFAAIRLKNAYPAINAVTIRNNNASGIDVTGTAGYVKITNSTIEDNLLVSDLLNFNAGMRVRGNYSGGDDLFVEIRDSLFSANNLDTSQSTIALQGGALSVIDVKTLIVDNNQFLHNSADQGGAIYLVNMEQSFIRLENNYIEENHATSGGGGAYIDAVTAYVINNVFKSNHSNLKGGGLYVKDSGVDVTHNIFQRNVAIDSGGGIFIDAIAKPLSVRDNLMLRNHADAHGGGLDIHEGIAQILYNTLVSNTAGTETAEETKRKADAIHLINAENEILNNTITGQGFSDTIYIDGSSALVQSNTLVANSNIWYLIHTGTKSTPTIQFNNVFGNALTSNSGNTQADIFNQNTANTLDLLFNWWGPGDPDPSLAAGGMADFSSKLPGPNPEAPISPPAGLSATLSDEGIHLLWNANPETDLAGYRVYWGRSSVTDLSLDLPDYPNSVDVGLTNEYTIADLEAGTYFVAVSAYDKDIETDDENTIVNESISRGDQSWYSDEQVVEVLKPAQKSSGGGGGGALGYYALLLLLCLFIRLLANTSLMVRPSTLISSLRSLAR